MSPRTQVERALRIEWAMIVLGALSLPAVILSASGNDSWATIGRAAYGLIWLAFVVELVVRFVYTPLPFRVFMRARAMDIVMLVVTNPAAPLVLQLLRCARVLRVFRLKHTQEALESAGLDHIQRRVFSVDGIRWAVAVLVFTLLMGGWLFSRVETGLTTWDGVWFSIVSASTTGYGDIVPHTNAGRVIAIVIMVVGVGFAGLITGAIAERFIPERGDREPAGQSRELMARIDRLEQHLLRMEAAAKGGPQSGSSA